MYSFEIFTDMRRALASWVPSLNITIIITFLHDNGVQYRTSLYNNSVSLFYRERRKA